MAPETRLNVIRALDYAGGSHTPEDVARLVDEGRLQCWPGPNSVILTEIIQYPQKRVLHIFLAAGCGRELQAMEPSVCEWGITQGCTEATFFGRPGWRRKFAPELGWRESEMVAFSKPLTGKTQDA